MSDILKGHTIGQLLILSMRPVRLVSRGSQLETITIRRRPQSNYISDWPGVDGLKLIRQCIE